MIAALRTEYRKLTTTRLWWVLLVCMVGYMVLLGAGLAFSLIFAGSETFAGPGTDPSAAPDIDPRTIAQTLYTLAPSLGYVFPLVIGTLSVTGEFRYMTVTPTFLAEPRRTTVLAAKLLMNLPIGLLFGLGGTLATVGAGASVLALNGEPTFLGDTGTWRTIALSVVVLGVWAMVGAGLGTAVTHQVAAVVVVLAFTQLVEPLLRFGLGMIDATADIAKWLPGAAGEAVAGTSFYSTSGIGTLLPWWQGLIVLLGYGLALAAIGRMTSLRHDIT